jgi:hypothetical protein
MIVTICTVASFWGVAPSYLIFALEAPDEPAIAQIGFHPRPEGVTAELAQCTETGQRLRLGEITAGAPGCEADDGGW